MPFRLRAGPPTRAGAPRGAALSGIVANALWLLAGKGVGAVLSLGYLALATRGLGVAGFGAFALILGLAQAMVAVVSFQSWQIVVRYGFAPLRAGDGAALGRLLGFCAALDLGGALAGCLLAWGTTTLLASYLGWSPQVARQALVFCVVMLLSIRSTPMGVLRLFDRFGIGALADGVKAAARLVGALVAVRLGASLTGFLLAWGAAEIATALAYWVLALRVAGPGLARGPGRLRGIGRVPGEHPGLLRFTTVTNLGATLGTVGKQLPVLLVGLVAGPAAAGGYRLAHQLGQSLARVSDMLARSAYAELNRASHSGDPAGLPLLLRGTSRIALVGGAAIVLILLLAGEPALVLVAGPDYAPAYPLLVLLGAAAALDLGGVGFEPALMATGRAGLALRLRLATSLVLAVLLACLLPLLGAPGAALAILGSSAVGLALFGLAARRAVRGQS